MKKGFTLLELLIVTVLFTALMGVFSFTLISGLRSWSSGNSRGSIVQSADRAIENMVRYIAQAKSITAATAGSITFTADINNDAIDETVTFNISGTNLRRTIGSSAVTLAPNTQSLALTYVNAGNVVIVPSTQADRDTIHIVNVVLTMSKDSESFTLASGVFCRNR